MSWFTALLWAALAVALAFLVLPVVAIFVDVGPDALADLSRELVRARERRAHIGGVESLGVRRERALERRGRRDGQPRLGRG